MMSTDKVAMWETQYSTSGDKDWFRDAVNEKLLGHMEELVGPAARNGQVESRAILVPLCGRTKDMIYLYNQGHTVVGCEWVDSVCVQFFSENNIPFTKSPIESLGGSLYQSEDGRLRVYQCDFLLLTPELLNLKFDSVLDIQSLNHINPRDRKQYVRVVRSLVKDEFRYLLVTIEYEPFAHRGRPHSISYNAVKELFGSFSNIKFVAQVPASPPLKSTWKESVFSMVSGTEDRVQYWQARWATGQSQWHSENPHKYLTKYIDELKAGQDKIRIFLPMCGKAGDLMWLYNQGHTVIGVDGVPFVVDTFFRESKLDYEKTSLEGVNGWRYRSKDGRMTVFACDFFHLTANMVGPVDAVYDRGALEAISVGDRTNYINIMKSLLGKEFRYVLNAYEYDDTVFQGPPRHLPRDQVFNLFKDFCEVDILEEVDVEGDGPARFNLEWMVKVIYIIKPDYS
jgi:thiopurine S-methyltransferase